ncbi:N-acetylmuramoyl-L-alanine amidase family protein [Tenacibaculum jejuense]|uniref:N-acetylmuramoyl-L-alanine amidase n=1 Tax=Tenacibaculum jejuense TaxID=584609 RepID=A0A238U7E3_9FLAO|nr:N-acetylmuramoyl-L-alanine amidase [Tenacibaculum jejuense]SNR15077.1 Cell wall hydrolase/autolysin [Tenacibaculum jejuense]
MQFLKFTKYHINTYLLTFLFVFVAHVNDSYSQKKYTVVLDAGHGGKDPGNLGNGYKESKIALKVVLLVGKALERKNKDIKVIYTRKKDVFVELHNRAKIANESKADLFVSIHCDSYRSAKAFGAGTFVLGLSGNRQNLEIAKRENAVIKLEANYKKNYDYNPDSPEAVINLSIQQEENLDESLAFAQLVQNNFSNAKRFDRSVKQNNFLVLRETVMPSVLIELGFLTNKAEGRFLNSQVGQARMANSITDAIERYIKQLKLNTVGEETKSTVKVKSSGKTNNPKIKNTVERKVTYERVKNTAKDNSKTSKKTPVVVAKTETKKIPVKVNSDKKKVETPKKEKEVVQTSTKIKEKEKQIPEKPKEPVPSLIEFKVQIAASREYLTNKNFNFRGLEDVEVLVIDEYYKYYFGSTQSFKQVKKNFQVARKAGHKDCFIVAFENGKKISVKEALRKQ